MIQALLFVLGFLCGPAIFWVLAKQTPTRRYVTTLWVCSVVLVALAFALRYVPVAPPPYNGLAAILTMWLAWIVVLALVLLAIRARPLPIRTKRIAYGVIAAATTLPWFGLYTAQMVAD